MLTLFDFSIAFEIKGSVNPRNELVLDHFTVAFPVLAIFDRAALKVTATAVDENCDKEDGIEIRYSGRPSDDNTPTKGHHPIGNIVLDKRVSTIYDGKKVNYRFARVFPPSTDKEPVAAKTNQDNDLAGNLRHVPMCSLDILGVLERAARQLGESLAELSNSLCLHLEAALLRHRGIPAIPWFVSCTVLKYTATHM